MTTRHNPFVEHFKLIFFLNAAQPIRVEVTPKAMVQCFDAEMTPQSFLDIYERHQTALHATALSKATAGDTCVLLDTQDLNGFTLQRQSAESLSTPITLCPGVRAVQSPRRDDSFSPARPLQDARFGARISA